MNSSLEVREAIFDKALNGSVDVYAWRNKVTGDTVDTWMVFPGVEVQDDGHTDILASSLGIEVEFVGPLSTNQINVLKGEL